MRGWLKISQGDRLDDGIQGSLEFHRKFSQALFVDNLGRTYWLDDAVITHINAHGIYLAGQVGGSADTHASWWVTYEP